MDVDHAPPRVCQRRLILCGLVLVLALPLAAVAAPAAPSPGTILQQNLPPRAPPTAPGAVITLPPPKQQASQSTLAFPVKRVVLTGNTLIPTARLMPLVKGEVGKTDHLADLQAAANRITNLYHKRGYPLAYAYLPAQQIKNGVVYIRVVEPTYDRIHLKMSGRLREGTARHTLGSRLRTGQPVEQASLERGLLLLNQTPGVRVAGTLVPGAQPATTSLEVTTTSTPLLRMSVGIDDYGDNATGRVRGLASASLDDPFGFGGQMAGNVLRTDGGLLQSEGGSLLSPDLVAGLRLGAYGSHTTYTLGGPFSALHENGFADQAGVDASMPLLLAPGRLLEIRLDWLHDRFGQDSTGVGLEDESHLSLGRITLDGSLADHFGGVTSGGVALSTGYMRFDTPGARAADAAGPNTQGNFSIAQAQLQRVQALPKAFQLRLAVSGQVASRNLDGSQQFYLGGPGGVMSYAVGEAGGDEGMLGRLGLFHAVPIPANLGHLTAGALLQGGEVWLHHHVYAGVSTRNRSKLAGAGVEVDYAFSRFVALQFDYVHPLGHAEPTAGYSQDGEFWASLQLNI